MHRLAAAEEPATPAPDHRRPILLMDARHDPVSAYSWVTDVHRQARGTTTLLTYEGWGHNVYNRSACTRGAVDRYLLERARPTVKTCPAA